MAWSWTIARIRGIDLKVHFTFLLILLMGASLGWHAGVAGAVTGVVVMLLLFLCVTLHEFGHAIVAQQFDIPVREIVLLPIGGVAFLSRNPDKAWHELLIAVAGPAVNVVIAGILIPVLYLSGGFSQHYWDLLVSQQFYPNINLVMLQLLYANIMLIVFNMIPAFPLDGGRVFRALLGFFMSWSRATYIAAITGQAIAILLGIVALQTGHIFLGVIAILIFFAAGNIQQDERARSVLSRLSVGRAYNQYALALNEGDRVSRVAHYLLTSYQPDFAVLRGSNLLGVVVRERVLEALSTRQDDPQVTEIMTRDIPLVDSAMALDKVREKIGEAGTGVAAVFDGHRFLGLVSLQDIDEAFTVLSYLDRQQSLRASAPGYPAVQQQ